MEVKATAASCKTSSEILRATQATELQKTDISTLEKAKRSETKMIPRHKGFQNLAEGDRTRKC